MATRRLLQGGSISSKSYFIDKEGQSNSNGQNTGISNLSYLSPFEGSKIWNETRFERTTFGRNNQNTINGNHGTELPIAMRLPKPH